MHLHTELSFVDEFWWVSPLHYLKNGWQNAVLLWCMLQAGPPPLHYYYAIVLHSCIVLPPVGHSSNREYHCCQLTGQLSCVSNFYRTFKVFISLSLVFRKITSKLLMTVTIFIPYFHAELFWSYEVWSKCSKSLKNFRQWSRRTETLYSRCLEKIICVLFWTYSLK